MKYPLFLIILLFFSCKKKNDSSAGYVQECDKSITIDNTNSIEGYSNHESYSPGDTIDLMIHSTTSFCSAEIIRHGLADSIITQIDSIPTAPQNYNCRSYSFGCDWSTTYQYPIPSNLPSGIYSAYLSNDLNEEFYISFVIKPSTGATAPILVLANTNTWQAYNDWGGASFYTYGFNEEIGQSVVISFHRPNYATTPLGVHGHLLEAELHLLRWLETKGLAYHVISDRDLHNGFDLSPYKTFTLNVHPEYWSTEMRHNLLDYLANGGNLVNFGANAIYWKVGLAESQIEVRKENAYHKYTDAGKGGKWRSLGYPESSVLGVQYDDRGFDTYFPYAVYNPGHWVFNGTGLSYLDNFGTSCLNGTGGGASGHETDKMTNDSPSNTVFLAKGTNPDNGGATMCYIEMASGAKVFSTGSIIFTGSLSVDSTCSKIAENVFSVFNN